MKYRPKLIVVVLFGLIQDSFIQAIDPYLCRDGEYRTVPGSLGICQACPSGHFCFNNTKIPCPAGFFGKREGLSDPECEGRCQAGYYCPEGSTSATEAECGSTKLYCPTGSIAPLPVPQGYFSYLESSLINADNLVATSGIGHESTRSSIFLCSLGHFCVDGVMHPCPRGSFGSHRGLFNSNCSSMCPEGWYCPYLSEEAKQFSCGRNPKFFCPAGSERPSQTAVGSFAINSHIHEGGGFGGQSICSPGSYCLDGVRHDCPAGRYGNSIQMVNSSCTGACPAGFYCPPGSPSFMHYHCSNHSVYCPEGSSLPTPVNPGYYTIGIHSNDINSDSSISVGFSLISMLTVGQRLCNPGYYCPNSLGQQLKCPPGRFGSSHGLSSSRCSGYCAAGFFCPEGSTIATQNECGSAAVFCPEGVHSPLPVSTGYYTVGANSASTRTFERKCEPGTYCSDGVKYLCRRGYYGSEFGMTSPECSGKCARGYYCPEGSISAEEIMCGDASRFCPEGTFQPQSVRPGYFSIGGNESTRHSESVAPMGYFASQGLLFQCRPGIYGASEGLQSSDCTAPCSVPGYFCPAGSVSPVQKMCGADNFYCPAGTVGPIMVDVGFYTADYIDNSCPPGQWRDWKQSIDPTKNSSSVVITFNVVPECQYCPLGTFKSENGDDFRRCRLCDPRYSESSADRTHCVCRSTWLNKNLLSFFNLATGMCEAIEAEEFRLKNDGFWSFNNSMTRSHQVECEPGFYCQHGLRRICPAGFYGSLPRTIESNCSGSCLEGYFCPPGSTSPRQVPCGASNQICPLGSSVPTIVPKGYYSNEDSREDIRHYQLICPPGYYCPGDGRRHLCPNGTYSDVPGADSDKCMGLCDAGFYCNGGSTSSRQHECGSTKVYCTRGSSAPTPITSGFYGIFTGVASSAIALWDSRNATFSAEIPCEPGYYCVDGIKSPCPPGHFGWRRGMNSSYCGGLCARGYYCPSYLLPQDNPTAPSHTVWPLAPHSKAAEYKCGGSAFYCPPGSKFPLRVGGGNYTIGGSLDNTTRYDQAKCPPGTFCVNGISLYCPKGRFGSEYGLFDSSCTGPCPPGFFCPAGTAQPIPCGPNTYSSGSGWLCSPCPGQRTLADAAPCADSRTCCFRDKLLGS